MGIARSVGLLLLIGCDARAPMTRTPPPNEAVVEEPKELVTTQASRLALRFGVVDPRRGVTSVTVGPAYDLLEGTSRDVRLATHLCGDDAVRAAREAIRVLSESEATCDARRCTKPARSEWDSSTDVRFAPAGDGTRVMESIVVVLDVPMRPGADGDFAWAEKRRVELASRACTDH